MSVIAGTIIFIKDDKSYFLVTDDVSPKFFTVKMHRHANDTALGSLLSGMRSELGINLDMLRLGELAAWRIKDDAGEEKLVSLYTFDLLNLDALDMERLSLLGLQFASAKDVAELLKDVDMTGIVRLN